MYFLKNLLFKLACPKFWFSIDGNVNWEYDKYIRDLIKKEAPVELTGEYTANINNFGIWISSYPYAYGKPYPKRRTLFDGPKDELYIPENTFSLCALTKYKLKKYIDKEVIKQFKEFAKKN